MSERRDYVRQRHITTFCQRYSDDHSIDCKDVLNAVALQYHKCDVCFIPECKAYYFKSFVKA